MKRVVLKPGKEKPVKQRHHWIFSGAIASMPSLERGELAQVVSSSGEVLGVAYFNPKASLCARMVAFGQEDAKEAIRKSIQKAHQLRLEVCDQKRTNAYRLIHGEGDFLPGLTVDRYDKTLVMQVATCGMELLKDFIVECLLELEPWDCIYEKSKLPTRKEERLPDIERVVFGQLPQEIEILENDHRFLVDIREGQKTGFFLDQRKMRELVESISSGKKVLNAFSYSGGFSIYAQKGGATEVKTIDLSEKALNLAKKNFAINSLKGGKCLEVDVFDYLRKESLDFDLVILDPPAFAKRKEDVIQACRGYKEINRTAMAKMPPQSLLLTFSCSYHVDEKLFQQLLFQAAVEAKRDVRILSKHLLAPDHPINLCHPEGDYLKGFLLSIN